MIITSVAMWFCSRVTDWKMVTKTVSSSSPGYTHNMGRLKVLQDENVGTIDYLSGGRADQSRSSSCCRSYTGCRSGSLVVPAPPAQNTCSCRSRRSARTGKPSELRTRCTEVQQLSTTVTFLNAENEKWKKRHHETWNSSHSLIFSPIYQTIMTYLRNIIKGYRRFS